MPGTGARLRRRLAVPVSALVLCLLASGCVTGAAQEPTARSDGDNASVRGIQLRNVFVLGPPPGETIPAGGSAPLYLTLLNDSGRPDRLVSAAAADAARSLRVTGGTIDLPAGELVHPRARGQSLELRGLTRPLRAGEVVRVTFQFDRAGAIDISVPVMPFANYYTTYPAPAD